MDSTEVTFDYVVDYIGKHPTIAKPSEFHITDADFAEFKERVLKSGFTYDPVSKKQLDELVKTAKFEGYYDDARQTFEQLESQLKHDVSHEIDRHTTVLRQMLESEIIAAYYYQSGVLEAGLRYDKQLQEALRVLSEKTQK